jgi:hypothetical protein
MLPRKTPGGYSMRSRIHVPAIVALTLALAVPALAQSTHQQHGAAPDAGKAAVAAVDPNKSDLLHQEYLAKTGELRGKITAKQAELETLLATKPGDEAAIKKLTTEISALRGTLFEQTTLFRLRYAKETGTPMRMTRHLDHMGGHGGQGMMGGKGMEACMGMMGGKGMMMDMGKDMKMDMGGKGMNMPADAPKSDDAKAPGDAKQ